MSEFKVNIEDFTAFVEAGNEIEALHVAIDIYKDQQNKMGIGKETDTKTSKGLNLSVNPVKTITQYSIDVCDPADEDKIYKILTDNGIDVRGIVWSARWREVDYNEGKEPYLS